MGREVLRGAGHRGSKETVPGYSFNQQQLNEVVDGTHCSSDLERNLHPDSIPADLNRFFQELETWTVLPLVFFL